jgi:hypothetical protein
MSGGAGIGDAWSRDPLAGCDRKADQRCVAHMTIPCASPGSDPHRGPSSALRRATLGMRPAKDAKLPTSGRLRVDIGAEAAA